MSQAPRSRSAASLLPLLTLIMGCSSSAPPSDSSEPTQTQPDGTNVIAASSETRHAIGVDTWTVTKDGNVTTVEGRGADGSAIVAFRQAMTSASNGDATGLIMTIMSGRGTLRFTHHADGQITIEENGLPSEQDAVAAAQRAFDDIQNAKTNDTAKSALHTLGGNLTTGVPSLIASTGLSPTNAVTKCGGGGDCVGALGSVPMPCW